MLLRLDPSSAQARLAQARANALQAERRHAETVAGARKEQVSEARAIVAGAGARAATESREFDRIEKVVADGLLPASALDRQRALKDSAIADERAARDRLAELVNGTRAEVVEQAAAALEAARAQVAELELSLARHTVQRAARRHRGCASLRTRRAPAEGRAGRRAARRAAQPYARVFIPETARAAVARRRLPATVRIDGTDRDWKARGALRLFRSRLHAVLRAERARARAARLSCRGRADRARGGEAADGHAGRGAPDGKPGTGRDDRDQRARTSRAASARSHGRRRHRPRRAARADLRLPRAERLRQIHDHPHALRAPGADARHGHRARPFGAARRRDRAPQARLHDAALLALGRPDGRSRTWSSWRACTGSIARSRRERIATACATYDLAESRRAARGHALRRPAPAARARARRRCTTRSCCSSTSRRAPWIRRAGAISGRTCSRSSRAARRSSCPRTTWTRPSAATGSRSSISGRIAAEGEPKSLARDIDATVIEIERRRPRRGAPRARGRARGPEHRAARQSPARADAARHARSGGAAARGARAGHARTPRRARRRLARGRVRRRDAAASGSAATERAA